MAAELEEEPGAVESTTVPSSIRDPETSEIELPEPTPWPLVLAFGVTLIVAGLVTSLVVTVLGAFLGLLGAVGWFRDVLPHERHEAVVAREEVVTVTTRRKKVERIEVAPEHGRVRLPIEVYPVRAGLRGGLMGSVAMALVAILYGLIAHGSIWYPINLLGGVVYSNALGMSTAELSQFNLVFLLVALALHITTSVLIGLLYGTMLPMFPRHPIVLGGAVAPILWSGVVHSALGLVNPLMNARINWWWFTASQVAFGLVAGFVVNRQSPVRVRQFRFAVRAGIEATGMPEEHDDEEGGEDADG